MKKTKKGNRWDATINTDTCDPYNNAELTLTVRLGFRPINPSSGAATGTYNDYGASNTTARKIVRWTTSDWEAWKKSFVASATQFWHGKFWLVNNFNLYEFTDGDHSYRPNIWCKFELIGSDASSSGGHHHVIDVVKLDKSETWFGSHSRLYDSLDTKLVQKGTDSKGNPIMQRAHVHEVGHLLGLGHVDQGKPHCPNSGNTNASPCYGVKDNDKYSVMGQGMQLRQKHANPWRKAMIDLSGKGALANLTDWSAKQTRHYPRTLSEVAANIHVTARPTR